MGLRYNEKRKSRDFLFGVPYGIPADAGDFVDCEPWVRCSIGQNKNPHNLTITRILGCPMGFLLTQATTSIANPRVRCSIGHNKKTS